MYLKSVMEICQHCSLTQSRTSLDVTSLQMGWPRNQKQPGGFAELPCSGWPWPGSTRKRLCITSTVAEVKLRKQFSLKCPSHLCVKHGQDHYGIVASCGENPSPCKATGTFPVSVLRSPTLSCICTRTKPQLQPTNPAQITAWQLPAHE